MKNILILTALFCVSLINAQMLEPVKWTSSATKISDTEYELVATATIDSGWHLYSQNVPEDGPRPTIFTYQNNGKYLKKGNTTEEEGHTVDDPIFEMKIKYFDTKAV
ncbi:MAG: cytochrome C biogenesis protein, partial [Flavobacteriaceae bacterium]